MVKGGKTVARRRVPSGWSSRRCATGSRRRRQGKLTGGQARDPEQMELSRLRAENGRLKLEVDILKKATAYFAKDAL